MTKTLQNRWKEFILNQKSQKQRLHPLTLSLKDIFLQKQQRGVN